MTTVGFDFSKYGIDPYTSFKKIDNMENENGYVSAQELFLFSSEPLGDGKKAPVEYIIKEQSIFKKYDADKNGKLDITEYTKMLSDSDYRNEILPHLGRGGLQDTMPATTTPCCSPALCED